MCYALTILSYPSLGFSSKTMVRLFIANCRYIAFIWAKNVLAFNIDTIQNFYKFFTKLWIFEFFYAIVIFSNICISYW